MADEKNQNQLVRKALDDYLAALKVVVTDPIAKALDDVFAENDFADPDDAFDIYYKDDLELFESDCSCGTVIYVQLKDKASSGDVVSRYSYYGKMALRGAFSEDIRLFDGDKELTTIASTMPQNLDEVENKDDWCMEVMVEKQWNEGTYTETPRLLIYIPIDHPKVEDPGHSADKPVDNSSKGDNIDTAKLIDDLIKLNN